jgi:hypothetical protein
MAANTICNQTEQRLITKVTQVQQALDDHVRAVAQERQQAQTRRSVENIFSGLLLCITIGALIWVLKHQL